METSNGNLSERALAFYESKLKALLEPEQRGKLVAIEPDTESYFLGRTSIEAIARARQALPEKKFFLARVGYPAAFTLGGYGIRQAALMKNWKPLSSLSLSTGQQLNVC